MQFPDSSDKFRMVGNPRYEEEFKGIIKHADQNLKRMSSKDYRDETVICMREIFVILYSHVFIIFQYILRQCHAKIIFSNATYVNIL